MQQATEEPPQAGRGSFALQLELTPQVAVQKTLQPRIFDCFVVFHDVCFAGFWRDTDALKCAVMLGMVMRDAAMRDVATLNVAMFNVVMLGTVLGAGTREEHEPDTSASRCRCQKRTADRRCGREQSVSSRTAFSLRAWPLHPRSVLRRQSCS